jgi:type IV pilus assembly protein PilE
MNSLKALTVNTRLSALPWTRSRRSTGFTLIELMITVAIVAILATIAYPSYRNYVIRGQIVNATNALTALQANMERYYQDYRTYANVTTPTAFTSPCNAAATTLVFGNFQLSCSVAPTNTVYTLQAAGITGTTVAGFTYTIDQTGVQGSSVSSPAPSAWIKTCTTSWETKEGQC